MFDFTGCRFCFDVVAGNKEEVELVFNTEGGEALDLSNASFSMWAVDRFRGNRDELEVEHGAATGELHIIVPAMRAGVYDYELWAYDDTGEQNRIVYGVMNAESSELSQPEEASVAELRKLLVSVPEVVGGGLKLRWQGSSLAVRAAKEAVAAAELCKGVAEKVEVLEGKVAIIEGAFASAIVANPGTNTWWVCGEDTGVPVSGADGKSPYIADNGHWIVWDRGEWVDTGISAKGLDGDKVRRIKVASYSNIPTTGETCNGGHYYYVKQEAQYAKAYITFNTLPSSDIGLFINGVRIINSLDPSSPDEWAKVINGLGLGVTAYGVDTGIEIRADEYGVVGNYNKLYLSGSTAEGMQVPVGSVELSSEYLQGGTDECYLIYAWLEEDGVGSWQKVGEKNDLAEESVYGLVKLGSNGVFSYGANVGLNNKGGLLVPTATYYRNGVVGVDKAIDHNYAGGQIGVTTSGTIRVLSATAGVEGTVKINNIETVGSNAVGFMEDGSLGVRQSSGEQEGVVRLSQGVDDNEGVAIMGQVTQWAYSKDKVYTKKEVDSKLIDGSQFATKEELATATQNMVEKTESWEGDIVLTQEQYDALEEVNPKVKYFII